MDATARLAGAPTSSRKVLWPLAGAVEESPTGRMTVDAHLVAMATAREEVVAAVAVLTMATASSATSLVTWLVTALIQTPDLQDARLSAISASKRATWPGTALMRALVVAAEVATSVLAMRMMVATPDPMPVVRAMLAAIGMPVALVQVTGTTQVVEIQLKAVEAGESSKTSL